MAEDADTPFTLNYNDANFEDSVANLFGAAMSAMGMNVANPLMAEMGFFNRNQAPVLDPPLVGRTHIFFTRPDLNLDDITTIKKIALFDHMRSTTMGKHILDHLMYPQGIFGNRSRRYIFPYENAMRTPFIPLLSNTCDSSSNGKDLIMEVHETAADYSGNKLTYAKGADESFNSGGEINFTFHDRMYSPVMLTFLAWITYMHYATKGVINPRREYINPQKRIDYSSSVYIFLLAQNMSTIVRHLKYTGGFPVSMNFGEVQHSNNPNVEGLRDITVTWRYNFLNPYDALTLSKFNLISRNFIGQGVAPEQRWKLFQAAGTKYGQDIDRMAQVANFKHGGQWAGHPYVMNGHFGPELVYA